MWKGKGGAGEAVHTRSVGTIATLHPGSSGSQGSGVLWAALGLATSPRHVSSVAAAEPDPPCNTTPLHALGRCCCVRLTKDRIYVGKKSPKVRFQNCGVASACSDKLQVISQCRAKTPTQQHRHFYHGQGLWAAVQGSGWVPRLGGHQDTSSCVGNTERRSAATTWPSTARPLCPSLYLRNILLESLQLSRPPPAARPGLPQRSHSSINPMSRGPANSHQPPIAPTLTTSLYTDCIAPPSNGEAGDGPLGGRHAGVFASLQLPR